MIETAWIWIKFVIRHRKKPTAYDMLILKMNPVYYYRLDD
jgi:hypothetical protein